LLVGAVPSEQGDDTCNALGLLAAADRAV